MTDEPYQSPTTASDSDEQVFEPMPVVARYFCYSISMLLLLGAFVTASALTVEQFTYGLISVGCSSASFIVFRFARINRPFVNADFLFTILAVAMFVAVAEGLGERYRSQKKVFETIEQIQRERRHHAEQSNNHSPGGSRQENGPDS